MQPCTTYHFQAEAENETDEGEPVLGGDQTFETSCEKLLATGTMQVSVTDIAVKPRLEEERLVSASVEPVEGNISEQSVPEEKWEMVGEEWHHVKQWQTYRIDILRVEPGIPGGTTHIRFTKVSGSEGLWLESGPGSGSEARYIAYMACTEPIPEQGETIEGTWTYEAVGWP